ncbi:MAG: hypothetical protein QM765_41525 [Myxococcales bacterium]
MGITLATFMVKTLGRSCSSSEARLPSALACSYCARASAFFSILASTVRAPIFMRMPWTAARVEAGKT